MKKWQYIVIFIFTLLDVVLTYVGVRQGFIEEANPLLGIFNTHPEISAICVVLFVMLLILFLYKVQHKIKWLNKALYSIIAVKIMVLWIHINWISNVINII